MKPMTEQEARAALKAEMPWARTVDVMDSVGIFEAQVRAFRKGVSVFGYAPTLRAAVAKAIKAWRATQKKGAKR